MQAARAEDQRHRSEARNRGRGQSWGSTATTSLGKVKQPPERAMPQGWKGPTAQKDHIPQREYLESAKGSSWCSLEASFMA